MDNKIAMDVLEEIQQLIQDRIGGGLAPEPPAPSPEDLGDDVPDPAAAAPGDDELSEEESAELAGMYEAEGAEPDLGEPASDDPMDPKKKKAF